MQKPVEIYRDANGKHRWRIRARNRQIVATSHQGYATRAGCIKGLAATGKAFGYRPGRIELLVAD